MLNVKTVQETLELIQNEFQRIEETEILSLEKCMGRILFEPIVCTQNIPSFNRSSVDGYAVRAKDTYGSSDSIPVELTLMDPIKMGISPTFTLKANHASAIPTGGELPLGADAVVMVEYTEELNEGSVFIQKAAAPGNDVILKGDDLHEGQVLFQSGVSLRSQDIGLLAAMGITHIKVLKPLRMAILSTGDEIVEISATPTGSQVRDVNAYVILAEAQRMGIQARRIGIVRDDAELIYQTIQTALEDADILVLSGGSSVGLMDQSLDVLNRLGKPGVLVHGIAVKPGKPTLIARVGQKAILGLPGHPASAFTIFRVIGKALIERLGGATFPDTIIQARLSVNIPSNHGREEYMPIKLRKESGITIADPLFGKSGLISLLSLADGYVRIKRESEGLAKDAMVDVVLFDTVIR
ncbi:MAG: gephyrin-like molybdotransferase Glp [Erysipelotrichaceae bacterium]